MAQPSDGADFGLELGGFFLTHLDGEHPDGSLTVQAQVLAQVDLGEPASAQ